MNITIIFKPVSFSLEQSLQDAFSKTKYNILNFCQFSQIQFWVKKSYKYSFGQAFLVDFTLLIDLGVVWQAQKRVFKLGLDQTKYYDKTTFLISNYMILAKNFVLTSPHVRIWYPGPVWPIKSTLKSLVMPFSFQF